MPDTTPTQSDFDNELAGKIIAEHPKQFNAPPRDPGRINGVLKRLREVRERDPDLRLAQIVVNAARAYNGSRELEPCPQILYLEDDALMEGLYASRHDPVPIDDETAPTSESAKAEETPMSAELQAELFRRYPKFFRQPKQRLADPSIFTPEEFSSQDWLAPIDVPGVERSDAWFPTVDELCNACEREIGMLASRGVHQDHWPRIAQIKVKFNTICFYVQGPLSDFLRERIHLAQNTPGIGSPR